MKFVKFFIGLLLFIAPLSLHFFSDSFVAQTLVGTAVNDASAPEFTFSLHSFKVYSSDGRIEFIDNIDSLADLYNGGFYIQIEILSTSVTMRGILSLITLIAVALYLITALIDNKILNIIGDIIMFGCLTLSLIIFFNYHNFLILYDWGMPIFPIICGLLAIGGLIQSIMEIK